MDPISRLTEYFREFPGIGPRQAKRFVYYLLTRNTGMLEEFSRLILEVKKQVSLCSKCFRFYSGSNAERICPICSDTSRDSSSLMIVSKDADFEAIEKAHVHQGLYFILGGTVPILEKNPESRVRSRELISRISSDEVIQEVILSLSATPDGEHTAEYVRTVVKETAKSRPEEKQVKITVLGRGLSTGSELEYADTDTIKSAFTNRTSR